MKKTYQHNPPHLFIDDTPYFITAAIYKKRPLLQDPSLKTLLLERIKASFKQYEWELHHWVILDNHYHLLGKSRLGVHLASIISQIHNFTGYHIKIATNTTMRTWWNYWDYCPRDERDYMVRLNYLLNNPVKYGYVENLHDYPYSSFHEFRAYPEYRSLVLRKA